MNETFKSLVGNIIILLLVASVLALPVLFLWNTCLVPAVDGINHIGFLQSIGLSLLTSMLFKSSTSKS